MDKSLGCSSRFCPLCRAGWVTCWIPAPSAAGLAAGHPYLSHFPLGSPLSGAVPVSPETVPPTRRTQAASRTMNEKYLFPASSGSCWHFPKRGFDVWGLSSSTSVVKNYLEKGFPISKAISERSQTQHLPSICSAVNSICKEKETELGMRCALCWREQRNSPLWTSPSPGSGQGAVSMPMSHICAMSGCAVSPTASVLAVELRSLWRAQLAAAGWAGRRDAQTTVRTILGGKDVILGPYPKFK